MIWIHKAETKNNATMTALETGTKVVTRVANKDQPVYLP